MNRKSIESLADVFLLMRSICSTRQLKEAMARLHKEIEDLTNAHREKTESLMLAETRLENRKYRPGLEQVREEPMVGLCDEVLQLRRTMQELQDKLNHAK